MANRYEYWLDLADFQPLDPRVAESEFIVRPPQPADSEALAELMIAAYRGTIDYDGETLQDALGEIQAYLAGERGGQPLLGLSRLALMDDQLAAACLVAEWQAKNQPIITYVMTHAEWKNRQLARRLLQEVLQALHSQDYQAVWAVITDGNIPSERLFFRMGFQRAAGG
jgi:RimJ/RimL family protein N-acetyltransferase